MKKELTKREKEIVQLVGKGLTSAKIAKELGISARTVDAHRSNAMQKTGAKNSAHLVAMHYEDLLQNGDFREATVIYTTVRGSRTDTTDIPPHKRAKK